MCMCLALTNMYTCHTLMWPHTYGSGRYMRLLVYAWWQLYFSPCVIYNLNSHKLAKQFFLKLEWANNNCRLVITQLNSWTNEKRPTIFYFLFALCVCVCVCASFIELFVIPLYSRFIAIHSKLSLVSKSLLFISLPFLFFFSFYLFRRFSRALFLSHAHTHTHTHIRADTHTNTSVCLFAVIWQDRRCSSTRCRTSLAKMTCEREKRPQRARDTIIAAIQ